MRLPRGNWPPTRERLSLISTVRVLRACIPQSQSRRQRRSRHWCLRHAGRLLPSRGRCMCLFAWRSIHVPTIAITTPRRRLGGMAGGFASAGLFGKFQNGRSAWSSTQFGNLHKDILWTYPRQFTVVQSHCFSPIPFEFTKDVTYHLCTIHITILLYVVSLWRSWTE